MAFADGATGADLPFSETLEQKYSLTGRLKEMIMYAAALSADEDGEYDAWKPRVGKHSKLYCRVDHPGSYKTAQVYAINRQIRQVALLARTIRRRRRDCPRLLQVNGTDLLFE